MTCVDRLLSVDLCADSRLGAEEHEDVPAGDRFVAQPGGGVRRPKDRVSGHQEHEEEPQLPQLGPLHPSGNRRCLFSYPM